MDVASVGEADTIFTSGSPDGAQKTFADSQAAKSMEAMMRDIMLGTIERHTEKIVSALLAISDQRVDDISKRSQQAEERLYKLITTEKQERMDMVKAMQDQIEQNRALTESSISKESDHIEQVGKDFVTLRLQLQSLAEVTAEVGPELQNMKELRRQVDNQSGDIDVLKDQIVDVMSPACQDRMPASSRSSGRESNMEQERKEFRKSLESFEALQRNFEFLKDKLTKEISQERARISSLIQDVQLQVASTQQPVEHGQAQPDQAGGGSAPSSAQAKAFKSVLDQRIKDVACTIDQVVKDFACSLEAERAQRQEGDRLVSAMARDLSKYKERLESICDDIEDVKRSAEARKLSRPSSPQDSIRWESAMKSCDHKIQEVVGRIDVVEESFMTALSMGRQEQIPSSDGGLKADLAQDMQASLKGIENHVQDLSGRLTKVEENCSSMLSAASIKSLIADTEQMKQETAGMSQSDYNFRSEVLAPRARALEEMLEQRANDTAGSFKSSEQREAIRSMQGSVSRLESLARNAASPGALSTDDASRYPELSTSGSIQVGQVRKEIGGNLSPATAKRRQSPS
jgi:hypothetical protein